MNINCRKKNKFLSHYTEKKNQCLYFGILNFFVSITKSILLVRTCVCVCVEVYSLLLGNRTVSKSVICIYEFRGQLILF